MCEIERKEPSKENGKTTTSQNIQSRLDTIIRRDKLREEVFSNPDILTVVSFHMDPDDKSNWSPYRADHS